MMRWSILAIAFAVAACGEGERDRLSRDATDAAAGTDSALRADRGAAETGAAGGVDAGGAGVADTAPAPAGAGGTGSPSGAEAMGGVRAAGTPLNLSDLSADQVRRLQTALNDAGCNAGAVDGVVGRQTRQAITCGLKKHNLGSDDLSGLYRSLGLES